MGPATCSLAGFLDAETARAFLELYNEVREAGRGGERRPTKTELGFGLIQRES